MSLPWVEKYRPENLNEIISHTNVINTLTNLINNDKIPHTIFYGPPGTGKTTTILACAKKIYGENFKTMILELNGSDDRGINVVREHIKTFSASDFMMGELISTSNKKNIKLVILDEADSMTYDAQFALRRVIENYASTTRFCLICNYLTKIIPALQSRCTIFKFQPIPKNYHLEHIKNIAIKEKIKIDDIAISYIITLSEGDMRKSINFLQSLYLANSDKTINITTIYQTIGYPLPEKNEEIFKKILNKNLTLNEIYLEVIKYKEENNLSVNDILREVTNIIILEEKINNKSLALILNQLAKIEIYLVENVNNDIQLASIISTIKINI